MENVIQLRSWRGFNPLINELRKLGYHIRADVLDAIDFGVPQTRRRPYILCDRDRAPSSGPCPNEASASRGG